MKANNELLLNFLIENIKILLEYINKTTSGYIYLCTLLLYLVSVPKTLQYIHKNDVKNLISIYTPEDILLYIHETLVPYLSTLSLFFWNPIYANFWKILVVSKKLSKRRRLV